MIAELLPFGVSEAFTFADLRVAGLSVSPNGEGQVLVLLPAPWPWSSRALERAGRLSDWLGGLLRSQYSADGPHDALYALQEAV